MEIRPATPDRTPTLQRKKKSPGQVLLRLLVAMATLAAALILFLNEETEDIAGFSLRASYRSSPTFRFFVAGNAAVCVYSAVSILFVCCRNQTSCIVHLLDMIAMAVVVASFSAATAVGYIAKYGNDQTGWTKVCQFYEKFCNRATISFACSFGGFLLLLLLCILSAMNKSKQSRKP